MAPFIDFIWSIINEISIFVILKLLKKFYESDLQISAAETKNKTIYRIQHF